MKMRYDLLLLVVIVAVLQVLAEPTPQFYDDHNKNSTIYWRIDSNVNRRNPSRLQTKKPDLAQDCGATYCESDPNYPTDIIQSLEGELKKYQYLFVEDFVDTISTRFDPDERGLCESRKKLIHPKSGKTIHNTWMTIVNNQDYRQGVQIEECSNSDSECEYARNFPIGVHSQCKQMFVYRNLLAINSEGKPVTEHFQFPSCCKCVVTSSRSYRSRSSFDDERKERLILS